jgi:hypothetical protein
MLHNCSTTIQHTHARRWVSPNAKESQWQSTSGGFSRCRHLVRTHKQWCQTINILQTCNRYHNNKNISFAIYGSAGVNRGCGWLRGGERTRKDANHVLMCGNVQKSVLVVAAHSCLNQYLMIERLLVCRMRTRSQRKTLLRAGRLTMDAHVLASNHHTWRDNIKKDAYEHDGKII